MTAAIAEWVAGPESFAVPEEPVAADVWASWVWVAWVGGPAGQLTVGWVKTWLECPAGCVKTWFEWAAGWVNTWLALWVKTCAE
jgi:hypothetical protein